MGKPSLFLVLSLSVLASLADQKPVTDKAKFDLLYNNVVVGDYPGAVSLSSKLKNEHNREIIGQVVNMLLSNSRRNIVEYAYQLWNNDLQDLVREYFPVQLQLLVAGNMIKIINKRYGLALKLAFAAGSTGDRIAYGDAHDTITPKIAWSTIPVWDDDRVYFKIVNVQRNQALMLQSRIDDTGERRVLGTYENDTDRHEWYFLPVYTDSQMLFYISNRYFRQALELGRDVDSDGDRIVYGHDGNVFGLPGIFGWFVEPY